MATSLIITYEQALYFRAIRGHLAGPGVAGDAAESALQIARTMVGVQSQQLGPSSYGVCIRARQRPTAAAIKSALMTSERKRVVRTWAQRETLHLLDPVDWPVVVAARAHWANAGRRNLPPTEADLASALAFVTTSERLVTRSDLTDELSDTFMATVRPHIEKNAKYLFKTPPTDAELDEAIRRFCAGRLLWQLCNLGLLSAADKIGREQAYAPRAQWFPDLAWPELDPDDANRQLIRRYLAVAAPATAQDISHFFNARMSHVKRWLGQLADELVAVECGAKKGLLALRADAELLQRAISADVDWPVRMLPMWDGMMMTHADKTWTLPDTSEHKLVWRRAAVVAPVVLVRGQIVATWRHKLKAKRVDVTLTKLKGWANAEAERGATLMAAVQAQADDLAAHLDLPEAAVK